MRALVADDHPLYLDATRTHLERNFPNVEIIESRSLPDVLGKIADGGPFDLILLDYSMPGMDGETGVEAVVGLTSTPVVVMSGVASRQEVGACITAGARGFIPKTLDASMIAAAVNMILVGGTYIPAEFAGAATGAESDRSERIRELSAREIEVLEMLVQGASNKEIARKLEIQEVTVKLHATRIFTKLGVKNRSQAAVKAVKLRLVERKTGFDQL